MPRYLPDHALIVLNSLYKEKQGSLDVFSPSDQVRFDEETCSAGTPVVALDISGLDYFGYSFAKHTIGHSISRVPQAPAVFAFPDRGDHFLEGIADGLHKVGVALYVTDSIGEAPAKGRLIGKVTQPLTEVFDLLLRRGPTSTGEIATALDITAQNAKNRVDRLIQSKLATRDKQASASGGHEWINTAHVHKPD